jgi:lipopolysaccharide export system protein LptA
MADSTLKLRRPPAGAIAVCALAMAAGGAPSTAAPAVRLPQRNEQVTVTAQSYEMDYKNNHVLFNKVRIQQGTMAIAADQAQGTGVDFADGHWVFRGAVKITMEQGQLSADEAEVTFVKNAPVKAVATGKPASFEQRLPKTGKLAQGHADSIDYDMAQGLVRLTKGAWISDGQRELSGESLKYNVVTQSVIAESSEQGSQRVRIIITPPPSASKP